MKIKDFKVFLDFSEIYDFRRKIKVTKSIGNRFWGIQSIVPGCRRVVPRRTHALDDLESIPNRFGDFYFSTKIMIFWKITKS